MNPKAGSFSVDTRLQRQFTIFSFGTPDSAILKSIYGQILAGHLIINVDKTWYGFANCIIEASVKALERVGNEPQFSPFAKKFHYQFNLRELSKVVEGLMLSRVLSYKSNASKFIKLWLYEYKCVIQDRLTNDDDINKFQGYLKESCKFLAYDDKDGVIEKEFKGGDETKVNIFTSFISDEHHYLPIA
jgi:dynein heavy chain